ncbi:18815_t:CDS:2 [Rhizophagus irregularis]|nr:18815_t:CDS:2 [Rhizophagus irregularis]
MDLHKHIESWTSKELASFLKRQKLQVLHLEANDFSILNNKRITGSSFFHISKDDLRRSGLELGPIIEIYSLKEKIVSVINRIETNPSAEYEKDIIYYISQIKGKIITNNFDKRKLMVEGILNSNESQFIREILCYHKKKSLRSFRDYNENSFQTAIELILPSNCYISEMRLIVEKIPKYKYGFIDLFLCDISCGTFSAVIELKLFNLIGLLSGEMGRWVGNPPFKSLIDLDKKLQTESEEELLNRNYFYWSKEELKYKSIKVKKYIDNGKIQLNNYINILKKGDVSQNEVGVFDERINVGMGYSYMMGI